MYFDKPLSKNIQEYLKDIEYVVESTDFERHTHWAEYAAESNRRFGDAALKWDGPRDGYILTIGELDDAPVCISLMKARIEGHWVLFWELTSKVCDYRMAERFLQENVPAYEQVRAPDGRVRQTDAWNFQHCVRHLERLNSGDYDK